MSKNNSKKERFTEFIDEWIDRNGKERKCNKSKKDKYKKN